MKLHPVIQKTYLSLHTWTGIICGLALFICFFAGSLTVFSNALSQWATPSIHAEALAYTADEQLPELLNLAAEQHPDMRKRFTVHWQHNPYAKARLSWKITEKNQQYIMWASLSESGSLQTQKQALYPLGEWIDILHETAGIPGGESNHDALGLTVMGIIAVLYFLALISGLILFLPRLAKDWLSLRVNLDNKKGGNKGTRRAWLDAHNLFGITGLPFHLMIAFTVVVFAFHDSVYDNLKQYVYEDVPLFPSMTHINTTKGDPLHTIPSPQQWIEKTSAMSPYFVASHISYVNMTVDSPRAPMVAVYGGNHHNRVSTFVIFNAHSGNTPFNFIDGNVYQTVVKSFFALHFGDFGGLWLRWMYFVLGLAGAALFYTGNVLWLEKRHAKARQQGRSTPVHLRILAALTVGVCFGSILGMTCAISAVRIAEQTMNTAELFWSVYYVLFLGSVILSIWLGANRTVAPLILSCAFGCASITLASILTINQYDTSWAVETTATLLCFGFILMAYKTHKRLRNAPTHDLWSY